MKKECEKSENIIFVSSVIYKIERKKKLIENLNISLPKSSPLKSSLKVHVKLRYLYCFY